MIGPPEPAELATLVARSEWGQLLSAQRVMHGTLPMGHPRLVDYLGLSKHAGVLLVSDGAEIHIVPAVTEPFLRRARAGDGVSESLLDRARMAWTASGSFELHTYRPPLASGERPLGVDQTNESIAVGDAALVKWHAIAADGIHPAPVAQAALVRAGFAGTPAPYAVLTWRGRLVAEATRLIPGAVDGWTWVVNDLLAEVTRSHSGPRGVALGTLLGELTARLHLALAAGSDSELRAATAPEIAAWEAAVEAELAHAIRTCPRQDQVALASAAERLRRQWPTASKLAGATPVMTVHGDLHVGQILRSKDGEHLVIDFDGNPVLPFNERHLPQSPTLDVASLTQSVVHAGIVLRKHHPGLAEASVDEVVGGVIDALVEAYAAVTATGGQPGLLDRRLLMPLRLRQVVREFSYAAEHLQRWTYVPRSALPRLLAETTEASEVAR